MTDPKPPLDVVRDLARDHYGADRYDDQVRDLARAYLALVEAARPFSKCDWYRFADEDMGVEAGPANCGKCDGCRLAALLPEEE